MKTGLSHFNLSKHAFIAFLGAMLFSWQLNLLWRQTHLAVACRSMTG
nr:Conjugative transfer protein TrbC [Salmonella enterica subsp. enterica serovar Rissen]